MINGDYVNDDGYSQRSYKEVLLRASNARELHASCATQKHDRMECIFFSPRKPRHVLEAVCPLMEKYPAWIVLLEKLVSVEH